MPEQPGPSPLNRPFTSDDVAGAARRTQLFQGLEEQDMSRLSRIGRVLDVKSGQTVIHQGEHGDRLFIVITGRLRVLAHGHEIAVIQPGETFGEMTLLGDPYRSTDVTAMEDSRLVEFLHDDMERLMLERPEITGTVMRNLAVSLAEKLRLTDLRYASEKSRRP